MVSIKTVFCSSSFNNFVMNLLEEFNSASVQGSFPNDFHAPYIYGSFYHNDG